MGITRTLGLLLATHLLVLTARAQEQVDAALDEAVAPDDLALLANEVHQDHCADLYASDVQQAASSYQEVGRAWELVDRQYTLTGDAYWLYWRGLMAECLGQTDQAVADLHQFVGSHVDRPGFHGLVREAKKRARRIQAIQEGRAVSGGSRRAPIAFVEDPAAEQELAPYELRRYRRSGYTYDDWKPRRHSLRRHVVLMWSLGFSYGPNPLDHVQAVLPEGVGDYGTTTLGLDGDFRSSFAIEVWPWDAACIGALMGLHMSQTRIALVEVEGSNDEVVRPETFEPLESPSILVDLRLYSGFTPLPFRRIKPLLRFPVIGFRRHGGEDGTFEGHDFEAESVNVLTLGGFVGVIALLYRNLGLETGVWLAVDLSDSALTRTNLDPDEWDNLDVLVDDSKNIEGRFHVAIRLAF